MKVWCWFCVLYEYNSSWCGRLVCLYTVIAKSRSAVLCIRFCSIKINHGFSTNGFLFCIKGSCQRNILLRFTRNCYGYPSMHFCVFSDALNVLFKETVERTEKNIEEIGYFFLIRLNIWSSVAPEECFRERCIIIPGW